MKPLPTVGIFLLIPFTTLANNGLNALGKFYTALMISAIWILASLFCLAYFTAKRKEDSTKSPIPIYLSYTSLTVYFGYATLTILDNHRMPLFSKKMLNPSRYPEAKLIWFFLIAFIVTLIYFVLFIRKEQSKKG